MAVAICLTLAAATAAAGLDEPVRASWKALPLREWAARVTPLADRPVILDRRLDPDTAITLECRDEPLHAVLAKAADQADAEVAVLRSTIRLVPRSQRGICERAEDARDRDLARLPAAPRAALAKKSAWTWPEAAMPRELAAAVAQEAGVAVEGIEGLPHDHFPAAALPALTRAERIDLVLAHFDRRVDWRNRDGAVHGVIVPLDADLPPPRRDVGQTKKPQARPRKPAAGGKDVFSLRAAAPLEELLAAVAAQQKLSLDLDRDSLAARGIATEEIVRIDVQDVSRDELLDRIAGPLGLAWRIEADRLNVFARPAGSPTP
jgi:hypothetical protein